MGENFESKDEAFAEIGYQADELTKLEERLWGRIQSDDIPERAQGDIIPEFENDFKAIVDVLRDIAGYLKRHHSTPETNDEA